MCLHRLVTLPVKAAEWSAGKAHEDLGLRKRKAGSRGVGWDPVSSWKCKKHFTEARSRGWGPWGGKKEQTVLADPHTP